jgi:hypothetical protein
VAIIVEAKGWRGVMAEMLRQPAEWRDKASEYLDMAQTAQDFILREQFSELAARFLDMAEKLEGEMVAVAVLNARPNR